MRGALIGLVLALAACGIDGPPLPPAQTAVTQAAATQPGVTVTREARIGMRGDW